MVERNHDLEVSAVRKRKARHRKGKKHKIQDKSYPAQKLSEADGLPPSNELSDLLLSAGRISETIVASDAGENKLVSDGISNKENVPSESSHASSKMVPIRNLKKKLLILDINGVLVDIVSGHVDGKADIKISRQAVFRRPFCEDFLNFCFERFEVGIWSSRTKKKVDRVIDFLMGDMKQNLLFCWDLSHCTATQFRTLENKHKELVFKDLRRIWEKCDPELPWEKGYYNESNTVLLDDSPYKALLNPAHTAIFPFPFQFQDGSDNSLDAGGALRVYLEELAVADNVQTFVQQHSFGQTAVTEISASWSFYSQVISSLSPSQ